MVYETSWILTRIIRLEANDEVAVRFHHERVSAHWCCRKGVLMTRIVEARACRRTLDNLKVVAVYIWSVRDDLD